MTTIFNSTKMFEALGLRCGNDGTNKMNKNGSIKVNGTTMVNRSYYAETYDPSYDVISKTCRGYVGEGIIDCIGEPPSGDQVLRICNCVYKGNIFHLRFI